MIKPLSYLTLLFFLSLQVSALETPHSPISTKTIEGEFSKLPLEIISIIFNFLSHKDLVKAERLSSFFRSLARQNPFWKKHLKLLERKSYDFLELSSLIDSDASYKDILRKIDKENYLTSFPVSLGKFKTDLVAFDPNHTISTYNWEYFNGVTLLRRVIRKDQISSILSQVFEASPVYPSKENPEESEEDFFIRHLNDFLHKKKIPWKFSIFDFNTETGRFTVQGAGGTYINRILTFHFDQGQEKEELNLSSIIYEGTSGAGALGPFRPFHVTGRSWGPEEIRKKGQFLLRLTKLPFKECESLYETDCNDCTL